MKKKNKKIVVISIASILAVAGVGSLLLSNKLGKSPSKEENTLKRNQTLAMYVEVDDGYELSTSKTFPTKGYKLNTERSTCKNGGTISQDPVTKAISVSVSHADQCSVYFDFDGILGKIIASSNGTKTSFDSPATTDEGIFEMEDDYGTSYYYRGAVTNNYVKFGKWNDNTPAVYRGQYSETNKSSRYYSTLEKCQNASSYNVNCTGVDRAGKDMYWRIIRVNGDGSLRIIYDGTSIHANSKSDPDRLAMTNVAWNTTNFTDAKYVGYMYGGANGVASTNKAQAQTNETSTNIKTQLDTWYKENIVDTGYSSAVADILFCNDRSTPGSSVSGWTDDTGLGYRQNKTAYGATSRTGVWNSSTTPSAPSFKCPEKNDSFTVDDTIKGNGDLTYPVALITADEIVAAGGRWYGSAGGLTNNGKYYLYKGDWYWSLSPSYYEATTTAGVFTVSTTLSSDYVISTAGAVAPVINLSAEYAETLQGTGTTTDPYHA